MAANSGGGGSGSSAAGTSGGGNVDWSTIIKPFVTYSVGSLSRNEVVTLLKALVESEKDFKDSISSTHAHSVFYDVVTVLATHVITVAANNDLLPRQNFPTVCSAAKILCESLLARLQHVLKGTHPILSVKLYINAIQEFSNGELVLTQDEVTNMLALLKNQELPLKIQSTAPSSWDKDGTTAAGLKEVRRTRMDPAALLFEQIAMPIMSLPSNKSVKVLLVQEVTKILQNQIRAGQWFVEICLGLPTLKSYFPDSVILQNETVRSFCNKIAHHKMSSGELIALSEDLNLVYRLLKICHFAPLNASDAQKLCQLGIGAMNAAFAVTHYFYGGGALSLTSSQPASSTVSSGTVQSQTSSGSMSNLNANESEYQTGIEIVAEAIWIQQRVIRILKDDTGLLQTTWLNCSAAFAKHVLLSIQCYMHQVTCTADPKVGAKISLLAIQQVWNEIIISVACHAIELAHSFMNLHCTESVHVQGKKSASQSAKAFKIDDQISNGDRIRMLFEHFNVVEMLIQMTTLSYRKACRLKLIKFRSRGGESESGPAENEDPVIVVDHDTDDNMDTETRADEVRMLEENDHIDVEIEDENHSVSDLMTTEDEDDPDDDQDDDDDERNDAEVDEMDDEPILGFWMESALSPPDISENEFEGKFLKERDGKSALEDEKKTADDGVKAVIAEFVREKDEPSGFMESALIMLGFLTKSVVCNGSDVVQGFAKTGFSSEQIATLLAVVIKDLDQEKASTEIAAISTVFEDSLNRVYLDFSNEISKLVQNILAQNFFSPSIQIYFLEQLGIDLQGTGRWPIGLYPKSLAVLIQVLLLKQDRENMVVSILKRILDTLVEDISSNATVSQGYSDMPVEHAQTIVFLFHTLSLMQKKQIMIDCSKALIFVSNNLKGEISKPHQLTSLGRLLLLFDYFIRQLYEPGLNLITQIQYNIFNDDGVSSSYSNGASAIPSGNQNSSATSPSVGAKTKSKLSDPLIHGGESTAERGLLGAISTSETMNEPPNTKPLPPARIYCDCPAVDKLLEMNDVEDVMDGLKPRFYNLISAEPNYQENPRLDGLAMNFLMNKSDAANKDKMEYLTVIDAILKLAECSIDWSQDTRSAAVSGNVYYIQYFLNRLMFGLPPPHEYLESLKDSNSILNGDFLDSPARILYLVIWVPRLQHRIYSSWIRDTLSKQGLTATQAEELAKAAVLSPKVVMKILWKAVDWISVASSLSSTLSPALYYGIEAALTLGHTCIPDISEDEEVLIVLIRILEESMQAVKGAMISKALRALRDRDQSRVESEEDWTKSACHIISLGSGFLMNNLISKIVIKHVEPELKIALDDCVSEDFDSFPDFAGNQYKSDVIPTESYLLAVVEGQMSEQGSFRHVLGSAVKLIGAAVNPKNSKTPKMVKEELTALLLPLLLDRSVEFLGEMVGSAVDPTYAKTDAPLTAKLVELMGSNTLRAVCYPNLRLAIKGTSKDTTYIEECIQGLLELLSIKDKEKQSSEFEEILLSIITGDSGALLTALLDLLMTTKDERVLMKICEFLSMLLGRETNEKDAKKVVGVLFKELKNLEELPERIFSPEFLKMENVVEAVCKFFSSLISLAGKDPDHNIVPNLLAKTIEVVKKNVELGISSDKKTVHLSAFEHVLKVIIQMASLCDSEDGHCKLFRQMIEWLYDFTEDIEQQMSMAIEVASKSSNLDQEKNACGLVGKHPTLQAIMTIMEYMLDIGKALQTVAAQNPSLISAGKGNLSSFQRMLERDREQTPGAATPPNEIEDTFDLCESEVGEEQADDEESGGDDSDDEGLNNRLCTYTITQKEFMSQHWYHCHTCGMVDGVGVCSICARVCHKGHDVTYAKFGSFFCDCGAKTDGTCLALARRPNTSVSEGPSSAAIVGQPSGPVLPVEGNSYNPFLSDLPMMATSGQVESIRRVSSPTLIDSKSSSGNGAISFRESNREGLIRMKSSFKWDELMLAFRAFSEHLPLMTVLKLKSVVNRLASLKTPIGAFLRVQAALESLRKGRDGQLEFISTDDLMMPTLGSQEGAFENIKMTYNGDQGSLIRQLITAQIIRRTTIAALSAPGARRHYLAMSQEKGKLTILQLGALLSGTEKKKLTLPRLATLTLPFTALTMAANPLRDDVLAVCGLKDCHVLVIGTGGSISSHVVLQPQLEGQNHIIKPLWLPGSQTQLALLSADAVKIYDLGKDAISPKYYFLLPAGKVRDATFVVQEDTYYIVIISNDGRIYYEKLDENTKATNGPYYITNDLNYDDTAAFGASEPNIAVAASTSDKKEIIVSIHYSHALKLLFYTYPNGKSYLGALEDLSGASPLTKAVLIVPKGQGSGKHLNLGLAQWTEVLGHPGLIFAVAKDGTPYALMMTEHKSEIQEIKVLWKSRPLDMVAMRHIGQSGRLKTSLVILGEDGSLKVFDSAESTEFWLSSRLRPQADSINAKSSGKKSSVNASRKASKHIKTVTGQPAFPTDFFEHCQPMNDVEFGGNDLLQIYNVAQLKNRLNTTGMYVVSTKTIGFNLEVCNNDASMVMTGIRILLGSQDTTRVPSFIQIFGRTINVGLTRARWYDVPLTREESLTQADSKFTITFGPSHDSQSITFVDSVKIYGKNKDAFGWPDDSDEVPTQCLSTSAGTNSLTGDRKSEDASIEKIIISGLELCELAVSLCPRDVDDMEGILNIATDIYLENYPPFNFPCRNLMCAVLSNKTSYYEHRDKSVLNQCVRSLMEMNEKPVRELDPEYFHHIVNFIRNIATVRPTHIAQFEYIDFGELGPMTATRVIETLCKVFDKLVKVKPRNTFIVPVDQPGIQRVETAAMGLAEIIYSVMASDVSLVPNLSPCLIKLLLSRNNQICVPVRTVLVKRLRPKNVRKRRVTIPGPSPPHCATPDASGDSPREGVQGGSGISAPQRQQELPQLPLVEVDEPIVMLDGQDNEAEMQLLNPLEAFMGPEGFAMPPGLDLHSDAEDEAMVELAIALSLQEQAGGAALAIQGIQEGLQALEDMHNEVLHVAEGLSPPGEDQDGAQMDGSNETGGAESDVTASPPPSDDEGSTVATEGSTMRNSEPGGSGSSGSSNAGGSSNERTGNLGGIIPSSSTSASQQGNVLASYMSNISNIRVADGSSNGDSSRNIRVEKERTGNVGGSGSQPTTSSIQQQLLAKPFRLALMRAISNEISICKDALSIIPLLQVMLVILAELDGNTDEEMLVVETVVKRLLEMMSLVEISRKEEWKRNQASEMALVVLRMLSILVSRWRGCDQKAESSWIARVTAETIQRSGIVGYCKELLHMLRATWKGQPEEPEVTVSLGSAVQPASVTPDALGTSLLKPYPISNPPDFSPFFLKQYIKTHSNDILEELPLLLSEMALRLPYQVKKVLSQQSIFDVEWEELLCEMLQNRNAPFVRRQARKLLLNIAGSRENYHLLRDLHNIKFHLCEFKKLIGYDGNSESERMAKITKMEFKYSQLVAMVEHLNTCIDIATQRPASWQTFCKSEDALQFIVQVGCTADESLTTAILTLLKIAIDGVPFDSKTESPMIRMSEDEKSLKSLAHQILDSVEKRTLLEFVKKYLLEHSLLSTRWQAHALMLGFFLTSDCSHQLKLVNLMWELWPFVPAAGSRAAQFVDILGYATLNNDELKARDLRQQVNFCIASIESQGAALLGHPNANIYASLVPFVSVDGYYLESEPCEVCYNIDKPYSVQKLNSIKTDAKFTANSQIVKLTSTLSIIRLSVRLTEVKKARMIKTMAIYYSPKNIPIVELKNKPNLWQMARKVNLSPSQTEVKLDFSVPIVAANVMLEFLDFYENVQASAETLQCPRCSASVPAQPGVCSNCGENVYQCHKCRAINYDERDPFLCHSCGFCKYAKLDISVLAKNVVAVDPIENEEDHKKAETAISTFLEKADQTYKQQQYMKAGLESMLQSIKERRSMSGLSTSQSLSGAIPASIGPGILGNGTGASGMSVSYASAAANALNNNLAVGGGGSGNNNNNMGGNIVGLGGNMAAAAQALTSGGPGAITLSTSAGPSLVLKNVQSLAYCYAIDCKGSYEELNRLMRKVGAYRKEMLKVDPLAYVLDSVDTVTFRRCYGCMASSITLSLKLLQALMTAGSPRDPFDLSFLSFLLRLSQSAGSTALKEQVKNALCFFVKDDSLATSQLTEIINSRVSAAFNRGTWNDVSFETSEEISLLSSLLQMYDSCWEIKLRSLMKIFIQAVDRLRDPTSNESGLLPCLKIIQNFIRATQSGEPEKLSIVQVEGVHVDLQAWMNGDAESSFENWRKKLPKTKLITSQVRPGPTAKSYGKESNGNAKKDSNAKKVSKISKVKPEDLRKTYLVNKYGRRWIDKFYKIESNAAVNFNSDELTWLKKLVFCPGSVQTRSVTAALLKDLAQMPERRLKIMELLTTFMEDLPLYGESCREFMELYRELAAAAEFAAFLNAKGALTIVCKLLDGQIEKLHHLETVTLHSDLSQGVAVLELSKLLSTLAIPSVRRSKRVSLLSTVLGGYLALKRLRLHRTRPIEEAQEILLQLLEEITSGTEEETKIFMTVCVETLKKCPKEDMTTPVFVFERVCSLIVHEEGDIAEFFVTLDKDPQQEDFLQGRMLGNPYSSNEAGIGPLMRDIKNKICTDCELVALLEDDNGMELLVNNKIMSLDLPVKEVYKKLWLPTNGQIEPMRIVYRMRGLLGDATEEFVESFSSPNEGQEDNEVTYKLANVFVHCGGLKVVLNSLENLLNQSLVMSKTKPLIAVSLKLLGYCAKLASGRGALLASSLNAVQSLLPVLRLCLEHDLTCIQGSSGIVHLTDQILEILEAVLVDSCALDKKAYASFAKCRGSIEDVRELLLLSDKLKARQATMSMHFKVLAGLTYTDKVKMNLIVDSFKDCFDFLKFDDDPNSDFTNKLEHICTLVSNVETGPYAGSFKDLAIERKVVESCLEYIGIRAPNMKPPLGRPDSDEWKEMASKPALKYVLRLLAGFATGHSACQESIGKDCVYVIHQLEQVSSDEHVGSLAENVLEALRSHDEIWKKVEAARRATREEKKRMAMAMRQRQLNTMGMKTNDKGQVTAAVSSILEQMEELAEETGLICVICREGYKYQPTKVLGIYTFSKRCAVEELETKSRKSYGYATVSHFNVVHIDCHMAAIRLARSRDEWESASLQNANTRCNGLIPLWGSQVPESAFAACLARHNAYLQEATGHRDVGFSSGVHDIKLLLLRFAEEKSFHEDTGGGGPESNMHLIPYLIHTALYVLNTTRVTPKEINAVEKFLNAPETGWKDDATVVEGGFYHLVVSLMVYSPEKWMDNRLKWLKRIMGVCGFRSKHGSGSTYAQYRPGLIFMGIIHGLYTIVFKDVAGTGEWPSMLADYIRKNDEPLVKSTSALLSMYQQQILAATEVSQIIEILGLKDEVKDPMQFTSELWSSLS